MKGLSTELECVIFKSNASCSFWNKADYESIKQGNPLILMSQSIEYIRIKSFKFFFISLCTDKGHLFKQSTHITSSELTRRISHSQWHALNKTKPCYTCIEG